MSKKDKTNIPDLIDSDNFEKDLEGDVLVSAEQLQNLSKQAAQPKTVTKKVSTKKSKILAAVFSSVAVLGVTAGIVAPIIIKNNLNEYKEHKITVEDTEDWSVSCNKQACKKGESITVMIDAKQSQANLEPPNQVVIKTNNQSASFDVTFTHYSEDINKYQAVVDNVPFIENMVVTVAYSTEPIFEFFLFSEHTGLGSVSFKVNGEVPESQKAKPKDIVEVIGTPDDNFMVDSISATTVSGVKITMTGNTFEMPEEDVSVLVNFVPIQNIIMIQDSDGGKLTCYVDGEIYVGGPVNVGSTVVVIASPDTGYHTSWIKLNNTSLPLDGNVTSFIMPDALASLSAAFELETYKIAVNLNGGNIDGKDLKTLEGAGNTLIWNTLKTYSEPKKDKCHFEGWFKQDGTELNKSEDLFANVTSIYVKWSAEEYNAVFTAQGVIGVKKMVETTYPVVVGTKFGTLSTPAVEPELNYKQKETVQEEAGKTFYGWQISFDNGSAWKTPTELTEINNDCKIRPVMELITPTAVIIDGPDSAQVGFDKINYKATVVSTEGEVSQDVIWSLEPLSGWATISPSGVLTPIREGTVRIKALAKNTSVFAEKDITIIAPYENNTGVYTYVDDKWQEIDLASLCDGSDQIKLISLLNRSDISYKNKSDSFSADIWIGQNVISIPNDFCNNFTGFKGKIRFVNNNLLTTIGSGFLSGCYNFNSDLDLSVCHNLLSIGENFLNMYEYVSQDAHSLFNSNITIPATINYIGECFMQECKNMTGIITINIPANRVASVFQTSGEITFQPELATEDEFAPLAVTGVKIEGVGAEQFKSVFPKSTENYIRKYRQ